MKINTILLFFGKIKGRVTIKGQFTWYLRSRSVAGHPYQGLKIKKSDSVSGEREPLVNFGYISAAADGADSKPGVPSRGRSRQLANSRMKQYFTRMNTKNSNSKLKTMWDKRGSSPLDNMNIDQGSLVDQAIIVRPCGGSKPMKYVHDS